MYCQNCGAKLSDNANYCMSCGTRVPQIISAEKEDKTSEAESVPIAKDKNIRQKISDKAIDTLGTKVSGQKTKTIRISMEDMLQLIQEHFINPATTSQEYKAIQKTIKGGKIGITHLESKDGNYYMQVKVLMQLAGRINILNPGDSNWIRVTEQSTGNVYQYNSFSWKKFKRAVNKAIDEAQR